MRESLGHFQIIEQIGVGGMGEVYRARDTKLDRDVAIKVLPQRLAKDDEFLARFQREAKLLAALNHPNIAAIHSIEESEGVRFLALELVGGETLAEQIARGPIGVEETLRLSCQIAEALEAAHDRGIIHRDVKPANIKITCEGKVKVLDFGLAKPEETDEAVEETAEQLTDTPTRVTGPVYGVILGTLGYISPEQARGDPLDKRTDIWSFGCVLYECLTGDMAFKRRTASDTLVNILEYHPDWEALPDATPANIRRLLRRCLDKDAHDRLRDIGDARIEIQEALAGPTEEPGTVVTATAPPALWRRAVPWALAVVAVGFATWALIRPSPTTPRSPSTFELPLPVGEQLAGEHSIAISSDAARVVYAATRGDGIQLYVREMGELGSAPITGTEGAELPFFSADNESVGFFADNKLKKVSLRGGAPQTLADAPSPWGGTWAPDGTIIFAPATAAGLYRVSSEGGDATLLTTPDVDGGETWHTWPEVLPGGKHVLFTIGRADIGSYDEAIIATVALDTGERQIVHEGGTDARYAPTGHLVFAQSSGLLAVPFDLESLQVTGQPVQVLGGVRVQQASGSAEFAFSDTGSLVYLPGGPEPESTLVWVNRQGEVQPLASEPNGYFELRLSPDQQRLVVSIGWANHDIWVYDFARENFERLTFGWDEHDPMWTPDSKRVVFTSDRAGVPKIFSTSADGGGQIEQMVPSELEQRPVSFSPDGKLLAYEELHPATGRDIWLLPLDPLGEPIEFLVTPFNEQRPMFSPDGNWIAYHSDAAERPEVYVKRYPDTGERWKVSPSGGYAPAWSPDGKELFYRSGDKVVVVTVNTEQGFSPGRPQELFSNPHAINSGAYDVAADGRFATIHSEPEQIPTRLTVVLDWFEQLERLVPVGQ